MPNSSIKQQWPELAGMKEDMNGGLCIKEKAMNIDKIMKYTEVDEALLRLARWRSWCSSTFAKSLWGNICQLEMKGVSRDSVSQTITYECSGHDRTIVDTHIRKKSQASVVMMLKDQGMLFQHNLLCSCLMEYSAGTWLAPHACYECPQSYQVLDPFRESQLLS